MCVLFILFLGMKGCLNRRVCRLRGVGVTVAPVLLSAEVYWPVFDRLTTLSEMTAGAGKFVIVSALGIPMISLQ